MWERKYEEKNGEIIENKKRNNCLKKPKVAMKIETKERRHKKREI